MAFSKYFLLLIAASSIIMSCEKPNRDPICRNDIYLEYPIGGEASFEPRPHFQWNADPCGTQDFRFQLSEYPYFTTVLEDTMITGDSYISPVVYPTQQTLYWKISNQEDSILKSSSFTTADYYQLYKGNYIGDQIFTDSLGNSTTISDTTLEVHVSPFGHSFLVDSTYLVFDTYDENHLYFRAIDVIPSPWKHKMTINFNTLSMNYCRYWNTSDTCFIQFDGRKR